MGAALKANSVQQSNARAAEKRVIPLANPTMPPSPEALHAHSWFAVVSLPGQERRVMEVLQDAGYATFLPMRAKWNGLRFRTKRAVEFPLLVRYLFVGLPGRRRAMQDADWSAIRNADGVFAMLGAYQGDRILPLPVPVENLAQLAGEIVEGRYDETREVWSVGDPVGIMSGPMRGFPGKIHQTVFSTTGLDDPINVLVKMMGRETLIHIPLADLQRIE